MTETNETSNLNENLRLIDEKFGPIGENSVVRSRWSEATKEAAGRGWAGKMTLTVEVGIKGYEVDGFLSFIRRGALVVTMLVDGLRKERARAVAAEQRAEALEREVARLRADRAVLMAAGLVGSNAGRTLPSNCLPMLVRLSAEVVAIVGSDDREALGAYVEALLLAEAHAAGEVSDG